MAHARRSPEEVSLAETERLAARASSRITAKTIAEAEAGDVKAREQYLKYYLHPTLEERRAKRTSRGKPETKNSPTILRFATLIQANLKPGPELTPGQLPLSASSTSHPQLNTDVIDVDCHVTDPNDAQGMPGEAAPEAAAKAEGAHANAPVHPSFPLQNQLVTTPPTIPTSTSTGPLSIEATVKAEPRVCKKCGVNIEHRLRHAVYCKPCARFIKHESQRLAMRALRQKQAQEAANGPQICK